MRERWTVAAPRPASAPRRHRRLEARRAAAGHERAIIIGVAVALVALLGMAGGGWWCRRHFRRAARTAAVQVLGVVTLDAHVTGLDDVSCDAGGTSEDGLEEDAVGHGG